MTEDEIELLQQKIDETWEKIRQDWVSSKRNGKYQWPALYETPRMEICNALRNWRKDYVNERNELLKLGKSFKRYAAHLLRLEKACSLMLPWFGGSGIPINPELWPIEMSFELDIVSLKINHLD